MQQILISPLAIILTLSTCVGIFMHETKVDKLTVLAIASPVVVAKKVANHKLLESMPHTHSDTGLFEASSREFRTKSPSMTPRRDKDEKYRLEKKVARGYHLFDSYHLPLESLSI